MPDEKTVVLSDAEWQQLVAIIANATGFMTFQKLLGQLQAQDGVSQAQPQVPTPRKGDGFDLDAEGVLHRARAHEPGR